jgi:dTDP-4-dehydrorhamnose 3,5-epimerase-like enzyme
MAFLIRLNKHSDTRGNLTAIEMLKDIPFEVKRVFYIYDVEEGNGRGGHRHKKTTQSLICVKGSCRVYVDNGIKEETFILTSPDQCLVLEPRDWHTMNFENGSILLVLASEYYDSNDYIYEKYNYKANLA